LPVAWAAHQHSVG